MVTDAVDGSCVQAATASKSRRGPVCISRYDSMVGTVISRNLAELLRWWEAGRLEPLVAKVFPLPESGAALRALLSRRYAGKIVLET